MTTRKPAYLKVDDWVDIQIRQAQEKGAFDDLPGLGKPIPGLGQPRPELAWVASYLARENVDVGDVLPPALAVAREVERLRERLVRERHERDARAVVEDLNERIRAEHARPQTGVVFRVKVVPVEPAIAQWRTDRAALTELARTVHTEEQQPRRRWWRRAS